MLIYRQLPHIHEAKNMPSSGNKSAIKEQTKSLPKEQFWLFSNPIKICLLRLLAEGIFYTYPHSIVPTGLGIRRNGQLFMYAAIGLLIVAYQRLEALLKKPNSASKSIKEHPSL
jgi:hypothetical protein